MARRPDEKGRLAVCSHVDLALGLEDFRVWMEGVLVWTGRRTWKGNKTRERASCCR